MLYYETHSSIRAAKHRHTLSAIHIPAKPLSTGETDDTGREPRRAGSGMGSYLGLRKRSCLRKVLNTHISAAFLASTHLGPEPAPTKLSSNTLTSLSGRISDPYLRKGQSQCFVSCNGSDKQSERGSVHNRSWGEVWQIEEHLFSFSWGRALLAPLRSDPWHSHLTCRALGSIPRKQGKDAT